MASYPIGGSLQPSLTWLVVIKRKSHQYAAVLSTQVLLRKIGLEQQISGLTTHYNTPRRFKFSNAKDPIPDKLKSESHDLITQPELGNTSLEKLP